MTYTSKSIRPFIGAKNFQESLEFYQALGFKKIEIDKDMCLFLVNEKLGFYLQDYYIKSWIDNSMIFLEVDDIKACEKDLLSRNLQLKYKTVKITGIKDFDWGSEIFMHDPSGILWHFGEFKQNL